MILRRQLRRQTPEQRVVCWSALNSTATSITDGWIPSPKFSFYRLPGKSRRFFFFTEDPSESKAPRICCGRVQRLAKVHTNSGWAELPFFDAICNFLRRSVVISYSAITEIIVEASAHRLNKWTILPLLSLPAWRDVEMKLLRNFGLNGSIKGSAFFALPVAVLLFALSAVIRSMHGSAASVRLGGPGGMAGQEEPVMVHNGPGEQVRVIPSSGSGRGKSIVSERAKGDKEAEDAALPPLPEKLPGKGAHLRRLLSPLATNLILTTIISPDAFSPMVMSGVQIFNMLYKPHEIGWAPDMKWDVKACQLVTSYGKGYEEGKLLKVSSTNFGVFASKTAGRIYIRWTDRRDPNTLWLKPRMEYANVLSTPFCQFDQEKSFVYGVEGDMGLLMAITMFKRLPRNSYAPVSIMAEKEFLSKYKSQVLSDAEVARYIESPCPTNRFGWDTERCHAHYVFQGAPGSHAVQYSTMSMRGLLRVVIPNEKKIALVAPVHPACTYKSGEVLTVGEVELHNGMRKLIIMMEALSHNDQLHPTDLVEIPIQKVDQLSDLDKEMGPPTKA